MQAVLALAERLNTVTSTDQLALLVSGIAHDVLGADFATLAVLDADGQHLAYLDLATYLPEQDVAQRWARLPLSHPSPPAQAVRTASPVVFQQLSESITAHPLVGEDLTRAGYESTANLPLVSAGSVLGLLGVGWNAPQQCTPARLQLAQALAALSAQTLARLRLTEQRTGDARRMAALVQVAQALGEADDEEQLLQVLITHGISAVGTQGAGLCLRNPDGTSVRVLTSSYFEQDLRAQLQTLPTDLALPMVHAATSGTPYFLPDRAAATALYPHAEALYAQARTEGSAEVPLWAGGVLLGSLSLAFAEAMTWRDEQQDLVHALAALTAQALQRIAAHDAEAAALAAAAGISETLQRSMLTAPPEPDHLQIAVRYTASNAHAEVGGDWYDAFITSQGATSLIIGDVTGHDMRAAAVMGQLRNLLRGIGFTLGDPPSRLLSAVDRASAGLGIEAVATAIVAQIEQDAAHRAAGTRLLRWSNAGHPPPLLIDADGTTRYLDTGADLLLGFDAEVERHDHEQLLAPGSAVLLYTDGLIERRGAHLQDGLDWLAATAATLTREGADLEQLCDGLLAAVAGHLDDDVALLALRAHPEDAPRPPEAGPAHVPAGLAAAQDASPEL
ncbi:GAF domain-containing SpoIIE family protein phosphatase [Kineococcus sp. SYSU DK005]|uniref:GAF domain-containing SpoIIE family protein phosphatase n=1 Tax=Kineococcus sp. SYSU DK005 TaxID=3383126 RepID=UPI003D7EBDE9